MGIIDKQLFPEAIRSYTENRQLTDVSMGYSGATIYRIENGAPDGGNLFLKIMPRSALKSIRHETEVTRWLAGKLPVPTVLAFEENAFGEFMVMTEIRGRDLVRTTELSPEYVVTLYANALKKVHAVPIADCPFLKSNEVYIKEALHNCDAGLVKLEYVHDSRAGMDLAGLRKMLLDTPVPHEDFVFAHGDYCFPNVLLDENNNLSGFIDFSNGGVSDRFVDIASGIRSTLYNMRNTYNVPHEAMQSYVDLFLRTYGVEADKEKIEFYWLIDDFFR